MIKRIEKLAELIKTGKLYFKVTPTEYDRTDIFLSPIKMSSKRTREYILNQEPSIMPECAFAGYLRFDGSVEGDIFARSGHKISPH